MFTAENFHQRSFTTTNKIKQTLLSVKYLKDQHQHDDIKMKNQSDPYAFFGPGSIETHEWGIRIQDQQSFFGI